MTLVSVVALIEHNHLKVFNLQESMFQHVVEFLFCENEDIECFQLVLPFYVQLFSRHRLVAFLVITRELANKEVSVLVYSFSLLLNKVGCGYHKSNFGPGLIVYVILTIRNFSVFLFNVFFVLLSKFKLLSEYSKDKHNSDKSFTTACGHEDDRPKLIVRISKPLLLNKFKNLQLVLSQINTVRNFARVL